MQYFRDKVSVITGGGAGIGAGLAQALAAAGGHVVVADVDEEAAKQLAHGLDPTGGSAIGCRVDVRDAEPVQHAVNLVIERFGPLDIMVNNAGVGLAGELRDVELNDWQPIIDVNLWGVIY